MTTENLKLINDLWSLWKVLSEAGEIGTSPKLIQEFNDLEIQVKKANLQATAPPTMEVRELASKSFNALIFPKNGLETSSKALAWHYWKRAYDSAFVDFTNHQNIKP